MDDSLDVPSFTARFGSRAEFFIDSGAIYVYGESVERRSHLPPEWVAAQQCSFLKIEELNYEAFSFRASGREYKLRSRTDVVAFVDGLVEKAPTVYLDITGLSHHVWAPLVTEFVSRARSSPHSISLSVVYVEPGHYTKSRLPRPGDIFALSEKSHGIRSLPGLLRLRRDDRQDSILVGLLGFEGWRFDAVIAQLEPDAGTVVPVIGVPGFRGEYPFYTFEGNMIPLDRDDNWMRRELATANDPFEIFSVLETVHARYQDILLRIAMVGTKPHALGAVLYCALKPEHSELIYDNPIRSAGRTDSDRTVLEYRVSSFLELAQGALC
jgi:hypothetical protein